jgi:hypothetical protein
MPDQMQCAAKQKSMLSRLLRQVDIDNRMMAMIIALLMIWVTLNFMTDGIFFTARNMYNLAVQSSVVGGVAVGVHRHGHRLSSSPRVSSWRCLELALNHPLRLIRRRADRLVAGLVDFIPGCAFLCNYPGRAIDISRRRLSGSRRPDRGAHGQDLPGLGRRHRRFHRGDMELDSGRCCHYMDADKHHYGSQKSP